MSIDVNMLGRHIANNPALYEPARNNNFDLIITGVDKVLKEGVNKNMAQESDYITDAPDVIRISVVDFPALQYELETVSVQKVNSNINYVSQPKWSSGSFKCEDFVGARTKDALMALRGQAYDITRDVLRPAAEYKHTWEVIEYNLDYTEKLRTWTIHGAWISNVGEDSYSHGNAEKRQISVTVQFDYATHD